MVDLANFILARINANWSTGNYDPMPILYHKSDSQRYDTGERGVTVDLPEGNVISVGADPTGTNTPMGGEFDYKVETGVSVQVEGLHEDEWGHITDGRDFDSLVGEVKRTINLEREWPLPSEGYHTLYITDVNDASGQHGDYYSESFTVVFRGYQDLP
ncbi:hypothetical protein ACFQH6_20730 [Halobacteriaceae archaeon GCM10025711]